MKMVEQTKFKQSDYAYVIAHNFDNADEVIAYMKQCTNQSAEYVSSYRHGAFLFPLRTQVEAQAPSFTCFGSSRLSLLNRFVRTFLCSNEWKSKS